ncbi:MAG: alpha/beta hydrolase-fold protein [Phycisphaerae bacterium]
MHPLLLLIRILIAWLFGVGTQATAHQPPADVASRWVTPAVQAKGLSQQIFESKAAGGRVSYHIYRPAAYDREPQRRFPVVYWLHGSGGGLPGVAPLAKRMDDAIEAGAAPACLVVFVNGLPNGMYVDWKDGSTPVESMIVKDLVPHIDATWRTIATREGRMLDGFSMGGYGAARLGFKHAHLFRAVSIMGAGPMQEDLLQAPRATAKRAEEVLRTVYGNDPAFFLAVSPRRMAEEHAATLRSGSLIRMVIGDRDNTLDNNKAFHEHLERLKIPHSWRVVPGVGHDPDGVIDALGDDHWAFYREAFGGVAKAATSPDRDITLKVKGVDRRAVIVNAPTDSAKRPAVIVLHGGMGSADRMRQSSGFDALAKSKGFIVAYGEGTNFGGDRHGWNTGHLLRRQVKDADDIAYLDALIDALIRDHGADPARVTMTGGSNGGMMTLTYAVARPKRLAAIAPVVATMFTFDRVPEAPLPILLINGAKDDEVPLEGGMSRNALVRNAQATPFKPLSEVVDFWVKANRSNPKGTLATVGTVTTTTHEATEGGAETIFVLDEAGGHGWPGTPARRGDNKPIAAFDGAARVWEFLSRHRREAETAPPAAK